MRRRSREPSSIQPIRQALSTPIGRWPSAPRQPPGHSARVLDGAPDQRGRRRARRHRGLQTGRSGPPRTWEPTPLPPPPQCLHPGAAIGTRRRSPGPVRGQVGPSSLWRVRGRIIRIEQGALEGGSPWIVSGAATDSPLVARRGGIVARNVSRPETTHARVLDYRQASLRKRTVPKLSPARRACPSRTCDAAGGRPERCSHPIQGPVSPVGLQRGAASRSHSRAPQRPCVRPTSGWSWADAAHDRPDRGDRRFGQRAGGDHRAGRELPDDSATAFVVVQRLARDQPSAMDKLLAARASTSR